MYHRERRKMTVLFLSCLFTITICKSIDNTESPSLNTLGETLDNNIIDFDEDYSIKFNKKYGAVPWESTEKFDREMHKYTLLRDKNDTEVIVDVQNNTDATKIVQETTPPNDYSVIPLELLSTTEDYLASIVDSTTEQDLTVIPLPTTKKIPIVDIKQTVTLPTSTETSDTTTEILLNDKILEDSVESETTTIKREVGSNKSVDLTTEISNTTVKEESIIKSTKELEKPNIDLVGDIKDKEILNTNSSKVIETVHSDSAESNEDLPSFSELDALDQLDVPEDYYDNKDVVPTTAPKTDALSVIFGLAGSVVESVVESVAERVVPKSIYDLFKRMQRQNEALEAERLRSREENGGLGQFGRGILKSISSGLSKPLSQLMQGVRDIGSLDTDRGFVSSVASGVTSVANVATSVADAFKDRVQAIYPGTVWCGDGHSATARSSDLGLFFFTDTCCRQHDACKIYIQSGETKYGLTNTGLFTRSHCSCDQKFRDCLRKTNSLVSAQIGLTYFNVLGPQCFRKAHPIVKCVKRTRITGQKCEEYELDYTKPKMWQWFDNETF